MYRVFYGGNGEKEAFFSVKEDAELFAEQMEGYLSICVWTVKVEDCHVI